MDYFLGVQSTISTYRGIAAVLTVCHKSYSSRHDAHRNSFHVCLSLEGQFHPNQAVCMLLTHA